MVKLTFNNAVVRDSGFGVYVNDENLSDLISLALGTKIDGAPYDAGRVFESNSCDVTITINPHKKQSVIEKDKDCYLSVEELKEATHEQFDTENSTAKGKN